MYQNETNEELRTLSATLYTIDGLSLLPASTVWLAGMVKISKAGAPYANAINTPVAITGAGDGAFDLILTIGEVDTIGSLRVRFYDAVAGDVVAEYVVSIIAAPSYTVLTVPASNRAWTLSQLRKAILRRAGIRERGTGDLTPAILNEFVNEALAELWDLLLTKADDRLITSATITATASAEQLALPATFYRLRKVEIVDPSASSGYRQLRPVALDAKHRYSRVTGKGYRYYPHGYQIDLVPTQLQAETLRVYYIPVAPVLVNDEDAMDGYNGYEELIIQLGYRRVLVRQELSPAPAETEITRLVGRISQSADGRDAEPFYLDPRGPNRCDDDDEWLA